MISSSKIAICFALVCVTAVSSDNRSRRSNLGLGTPSWLSWGSANNAGSSGISNLGEIDNQNINERNEWQQGLRNLGRISELGENRQQLQGRGEINSDLSQIVLKNGNVQWGSRRQNGYGGLGSYRAINSNQRNEQALIGDSRQNQLQGLNQLRNNQLRQPNVNGDNTQWAEISSLRGQSSEENAGLKSLGNIANANRLNLISNSGLQLGQQRGSEARGWIQQGWRNSGRIGGWNNLGQNLARSNEVLNQQNLWGSEAENVNIQENRPNSAQQLNRNGNRLSTIQSWGSWRNAQPNSQEILAGNANIGQQPLNSQWYAQGLSGQNNNVENRPEQQTQTTQLNQQQPNVYTYGELNAKIWKVLKSNPAMISNLENVREQLLSGRDSGNEQMKQLRGLLQEARQYNRNNLIPGNGIIGQTPEEQERNVVVANLIDVMNQSRIQSKPIGNRGGIGYGGWRV